MIATLATNRNSLKTITAWDLNWMFKDILFRLTFLGFLLIDDGLLIGFSGHLLMPFILGFENTLSPMFFIGIFCWK
jgi:hypothetical protein